MISHTCAGQSQDERGPGGVADHRDTSRSGARYRGRKRDYEPAPALLARHIQCLARLYLKLEAMESIRDTAFDHRAQQNTIEVRSSHRDMDAEPGVAPRKAFERGLHDLPDSHAKLKRQPD